MATSYTNKILQNIQYLGRKDHRWSGYLLLIFACCWILFWQLGTTSIRMVDESRLAVNAMEMARSGNLLVTYYHGHPDLYNTKPPLLIWAIAGCMKLFGYNEWSLRLPSALSALFTILVVLSFSKRHFLNEQTALLSGAVLITSIGFVGDHVARTGDYDSMLVLWCTVYSLNFFTYLQEDTKHKNRYLFLAALALTLAILTKGPAGVLCLPGLFVYTLWQKKLRQTFANPILIPLLIGVAVIASSYYLLRDYYNPGYLQAVIRNEITVRYLQAAEGSEGSFLFYFKNILLNRFMPWFLLLPAAFGFTWMNANDRIRQFSRFAACFLGTYFLIVTFGKTKLDWYDAPLFPIASIVIGLGLVEAISWLNAHRILDHSNYQKFTIVSGLTLAMVFGKTALQVLPIHSDKDIDDLRYGYYLRQLAEQLPLLRQFSIVHFAFGRLNDGPPNGDSRGFDYTGYYAPILFYQQALALRGYQIQVRTMENPLQKQETVITCNPAIKALILREYTTEQIHSGQCCVSLRILSPKPTEEPIVRLSARTGEASTPLLKFGITL